MKKKIINISLITILTIILSMSFYQCKVKSSDDSGGEDTETPTEYILHLVKAMGNLKIICYASTDTYEAYFHIPIAFEEQVPIFLEIKSNELVNYRFVRLAPPNVIVCATMKKSIFSELNWQAWVLIKEVKGGSSGLPDFVAMPHPEDLPAETLPWLNATACVQVDDPLIGEKAAAVRGNKENLLALRYSIASFCKNEIASGLNRTPWSFDAVSAIKWGNTCTGHAHAGAALFRANGVPARSILNIPHFDPPASMDMHWIIDYYIPAYGWIKMETSQGLSTYDSYRTVVTMVCEPEYENPLFYPSGIEGYWFSSDPNVGIPNWGSAHSAVTGPYYTVSKEELDHVHSLANSVWDRYIDLRGINAGEEAQAYIETAYGYQSEASGKLWAEDIAGGIDSLQNAFDNLERVAINPIQTIFFDDFENGRVGWDHGGTEDEWEWGPPAYGTFSAHSGENCWGTDLDDNYENNADCWLLSPVIDLGNLSCAYLSVYIRNSLAGDNRQGTFLDPFWIEIREVGKSFQQLCTSMGGVNDDPEIPDAGDWGFLTLDLTRYTGSKVQIRFRLKSNEQDVSSGSHIDDFHVYGRISQTSD